MAEVLIRTEAQLARNQALLEQRTVDLEQAERKYATELELRRYNLDWFRAHEFAQLEERVDLIHDEYIKCRK